MRKLQFFCNLKRFIVSTSYLVISGACAISLEAGAELEGCQGGPLPPKIFLGPPVAFQNFPRDVMLLH